MYIFPPYILLTHATKERNTTMYTNDYNSNNYRINDEREGAFAYDLKRLYDIFPRNSCVIYQFHDIEDEESFFDLTFFKFEISDKGAKEQIDHFLTGYGKGPFRLHLEWRKGFGNTIIVDVYRCL